MAIMLRDSRTASHNFRLNNNSWDGIPKPKFLYYVRFLRSNPGSTNNGSSEGDWAKGIGILAKSIDRPKIQFDTDVVNQYNKKRIIQKRVEYEPIGFTFHDTVDNRVFHMFEDYFRYYYGDPRNTSAADWSWDITAQQMQTGQAGAWGFIPPIDGTNNTYFFSHIEFYYIYGGKYSRYDIVNPKIKSFRPSSMEYESNSGAEIQMDFEYEGIVYQGNNFDLASQSGLLTEMGLASSGFYEPRTNSGTVIMESSSYNSRLGEDPYFFGGDLFGTDLLNQATGSTSSTRSSVVIEQNSSFNSVVTGYLSRETQGTTDETFGGPTIGDNIAKRMVKGMK